MKKYIMSEEEYEALDNVMDLAHLDYLNVCQSEELGDYFEDLDEGEDLSLEEGLQLVYESDANEICFENGDITQEEYDIVNDLFEKFEIM